MAEQTHRVLIAPACFKGSLSAQAAAQTIQAFLRENLPDSITINICPVADGGDDTLAVLADADSGFAWRKANVTGPLPGMSVQARYLLHPARKLAVLEAAQAHGLKLLNPNEYNAMAATSYGVGELLKAVIQEVDDLETIVITVGGSASTDGGLGALQALGVRFLDESGQPLAIPLAGQNLRRIQTVESFKQWAFPGRILIATDVVNPLLGTDGTATVFAPQKGATPEQCAELEAGLTHISALMSEAYETDISGFPGVGAAGGLAYGLRHLPRSGIASGSQWVADQQELPRRIQEADVVITGEGRFDATSFNGKATGNVLVWAGTKPVLIVCGQVQDGLAFPENVQVFPLVKNGATAQVAMDTPEKALQQALQESLPTLRHHLGL